MFWNTLPSFACLHCGWNKVYLVDIVFFSIVSYNMLVVLTYVCPNMVNCSWMQLIVACCLSYGMYCTFGFSHSGLLFVQVPTVK